MPWIESHTEVGRHRKLIHVAEDLSLPLPQVVGHMHLLWHAILEQQEDGDLGEWSDSMIARQAQYEGDASEFVKVLTQRKLFDENRLVHDWLDYAGNYLTRKYRTSNPKKLKDIFKLHKSANSPTKVRSKSANSRLTIRGRSSPLISSSLGSEEGGVQRGENGSRRPAQIPVRGGWPSVEALAAVWNEHAPAELMAVEVYDSESRVRKAREFLIRYPDREWWVEAVKELKKSPFLRGLKAGKGHDKWKANFDWMFGKNKDGAENLVRLYEGVFRE